MNNLTHCALSIGYEKNMLKKWYLPNLLVHKLITA
jgi:hypothetical protein